MTMDDTKGSMVTVDPTVREELQLSGAVMTNGLQSTKAHGPGQLATVVSSRAPQQGSCNAVIMTRNNDSTDQEVKLAQQDLTRQRS
jgi:hypothetical protein